MGEQAQSELQILVDVRSRLDDLVKSQEAFRKLRQEATGFDTMLKTGVGIDLARRGLDLLTSSLKESVFEAFRMADEIKDGARNLEVTNEAYQVLGNILKDAGGDASLLTMAISNSNRSLVEARTISSAAAGAYRTLGLDIAKLEGLPAERRFELIGRAVLNAKDRTQAYSAASQILGSRNLPTLLGALKDLATGGWDNLAEAQRRAGRVMTDDTIVRLEEARKAIEKFKQAETIAVGEAINLSSALFESLKKDFVGTMGEILSGNHVALAQRLALDHQADPQSPNGPSGEALKQIDLNRALAISEYDLAAAVVHRQTVEANPNATDYAKRRTLIQLMQTEVDLRNKLIAATAATALGPTETQQDRDLKIKTLQERNQQLLDQLHRLQYGNQFSDSDTGSRDRFNRFVEDGGVSGFSPGGSARVGAMDWVTGLGSQGEQVSGALQSSLGATVQGISDGIYGWATGTESFGEMIGHLGDTVFKTFLNTIVQMGIQWLVTQALVKTGMITTQGLGETLRAQREAAAAKEGAVNLAANTPGAAAASISSFGAAAILGVVALMAALALFGGFSSGGYTGDMPTSQVAGVVHGKEYVLNAGATRRLGTGFLDAVNSGASVSSVASSQAAFGGSGAQALSRESTRNTYLLLDRASFSRMMQEDSEGFFREILAREMRS